MHRDKNLLVNYATSFSTRQLETIRDYKRLPDQQDLQPQQQGDDVQLPDHQPNQHPDHQEEPGGPNTGSQDNLNAGASTRNTTSNIVVT